LEVSFGQIGIHILPPSISTLREWCPMAHTTKSKKQLLTRVRRIKGQTEALEKALDEGIECAAILQQISAIRGAVNGLMTEVLEGHIREHLGTDDASPEQRQEDLDQVIEVVRRYLK
jgi:DNA-binding FrmR family transcriptional regulator